MVSNIVHRRNGLDPVAERALYRGTEPPRVYRRVKLSKDEPYDTTQTYPVLYG